MRWSGWFWVVLPAYVAGCILARKSRQWLTFYVWGAAGLTILLAYLALVLGGHQVLVRSEMWLVQRIIEPWISCRNLGSQVLLVEDPSGWSMLCLGAECSALLEMACLLGLVLFYPRLGVQQRICVATLGTVATYLLNILRLLVILFITHSLGKPSVMLAHTVVGRLVFFAGTVWIYWHLITRPTLALIRGDVEGRRVAHA